MLPYTNLYTTECTPSLDSCQQECLKHENCVGSSVDMDSGCRLNGWAGTSDFRWGHSAGDFIDDCEITGVGHNSGSTTYTASQGANAIFYKSLLDPGAQMICRTFERWASDRPGNDFDSKTDTRSSKPVLSSGSHS